MAKVLTYTVDYCPYCKKAKALLREKGVDFEDVDITANEDEMREKLSGITGGRTTVPQIFINGVHIGGYTDLKVLDDSGKLDEMLTQ
ncbi:MAG: glutaredoxin 3 [Candidatus Melainabacteria bacterium GWA2_34_9]|nr:MAG: glutaredoxin 3 [Candidatus Melainabacteria bacterium GWA2_34_9]